MEDDTDEKAWSPVHRHGLDAARVRGRGQRGDGTRHRQPSGHSRQRGRDERDDDQRDGRWAGGQVTASPDGVTEIFVDSGDGDDTVTNATALASTINGGPGNDT